MGKIKSDQPLIASVLDRLLNDEPDVQREAPKSRNQVLRDLKQSVRRDLENLLNTRRRCVSWPENLTELERSLVSYGIPDVTGASLGSERSRVDFCRAIEGVIKAFEPRFKTVKVRPVQNADALDRTLRFRIDALLIADPAPEPVVFDSSLEPGTGNFDVKGVS
jgi:type VI secretion system protein ImpF